MRDPDPSRFRSEHVQDGQDDKWFIGQLLTRGREALVTSGLGHDALPMLKAILLDLPVLWGTGRKTLGDKEMFLQGLGKR